MLDVNATKENHLRRYGAEPTVFLAPGRVNLIGEHTDYSEGFVLPAAIDFATLAAISLRDDHRVSIFSENFGEQADFDLASLPEKAAHHWTDYPIGVLTQLIAAGFKPKAFHLTLAGDVPLGSGLSSSASVEVATAIAILGTAVEGDAASDFPPPQVARLCQRAENHFVGTQSGIMDQFVSCCGAANHALLLDCRDLSFSLASIPDGLAIVICNTMIKHSHAGGEYNTRRKEIEEGVEILRRYRPEVKFLRDATPEDLEVHRDEMAPDVLKRCRHVVTENLRTVAAAKALEANDLPTLGRLMAESHASYRDDFEASCKEADILVELASRDSACVGSRLTGGGFGGCTVNLVKAEEASGFSERLVAAYREATGISAEIYQSLAGAGAHRL
jgi:galactokinase